jgi:hypothetical protein
MRKLTGFPTDISESFVEHAAAGTVALPDGDWLIKSDWAVLSAATTAIHVIADTEVGKVHREVAKALRVPRNTTTGYVSAKVCAVDRPEIVEHAKGTGGKLADVVAMAWAVRRTGSDASAPLRAIGRESPSGDFALRWQAERIVGSGRVHEHVILEHLLWGKALALGRELPRTRWNDRLAIGLLGGVADTARGLRRSQPPQEVLVMQRACKTAAVIALRHLQGPDGRARDKSPAARQRLGGICLEALSRAVNVELRRPLVVPNDRSKH